MPVQDLGGPGSSLPDRLGEGGDVDLKEDEIFFAFSSEHFVYLSKILRN